MLLKLDLGYLCTYLKNEHFHVIIQVWKPVESYFICHEKPTILKLFDRLRKWDGSVNSYPPSLGDYKIAHVRDLTTGYDSREPDLNAVSFFSQFLNFSDFDSSLINGLTYSKIIHFPI